MTISFYSFLLLAVALSMDTFAAGLSYSAGKVRVPLLSMIIISLISGLMLTLSLLTGNLIVSVIPVNVTKIFSFIILFVLALYKLYDALPSNAKAARSFTTDFISEKVNKKDIHILSSSEAALLSLALSIDSISAGLGSGAPAQSPFLLFAVSSLIQLAAICCGLLSGRLLLQKTSHNFAWLSAALLFVLAFLRLF